MPSGEGFAHHGAGRAADARSGTFPEQRGSAALHQRRHAGSPRKSTLFTETVAVLDDEIYPEDEASCWGEWEVFYHLNREAVRRNCHTFSFKTGDFTPAKAEHLVREHPLGLILLHQNRTPSEAIRRLLDGCRSARDSAGPV